MGGVPWDDQWQKQRGHRAPEKHSGGGGSGGADSNKGQQQNQVLPSSSGENETRSVEKDLTVIGKHFLMGGVIGGVAGGVFGFSDVLMDSKKMTGGKADIVKGSIMRFGASLGTYMSCYYGFKKTLGLYNYFVPFEWDRDGFNDVSSAVVAFAPILAHAPFRRYWKHAAILLVFDMWSSRK